MTGCFEMTLKICETPKTNPGKIIPFERPPDKFEKSMLELIELNRQGKVANFIGVWNLKEAPSAIHRNWWGESCCMCLGLSARMVEEINRYINGEIDE